MAAAAAPSRIETSRIVSSSNRPSMPNNSKKEPTSAGLKVKSQQRWIPATAPASLRTEAEPSPNECAVLRASSEPQADPIRLRLPLLVPLNAAWRSCLRLSRVLASVGIKLLLFQKRFYFGAE